MDEEAPADVASQQQEPEASIEMCCQCFDVLLQELRVTTTTTNNNNNNNNNNKRSIMMNPSSSKEESSPSCPLFVTWEKRTNQKKKKKRTNNHNNDDDDDEYEYRLRGCIGTLSPKPLYVGLTEYAKTSALRDRRFSPMTTPEIPELRVGVSLLVRYEECHDAHDWMVGTHGIVIQFQEPPPPTATTTTKSKRNHNNNNAVNYSATFLPEVAKEQGWNQQQTLESLIRKSGYRGAITQELVKTIRCTRYQSSKQRLTYQEYVAKIGHDPLLTINNNAASAATTTGRNWCLTL